jgi:uncharacterized protein (DUF486 family)
MTMIDAANLPAAIATLRQYGNARLADTLEAQATRIAELEAEVARLQSVQEVTHDLPHLRPLD